ncbi:MAG: hypothetical protein ACOCQR_03100 [bacterium]
MQKEKRLKECSADNCSAHKYAKYMHEQGEKTDKYIDSRFCAKIGCYAISLNENMRAKECSPDNCAAHGYEKWMREQEGQ